MSSLEDIIDLPANLGVKRALAVKMILFDFHKAALARPKGARPVVQTTGFQPLSLSVGGLVRRSSTHQLLAGGC